MQGGREEREIGNRVRGYYCHPAKGATRGQISTVGLSDDCAAVTWLEPHAKSIFSSERRRHTCDCIDCVSRVPRGLMRSTPEGSTEMPGINKCNSTFNLLQNLQFTCSPSGILRCWGDTSPMLVALSRQTDTNTMITVSPCQNTIQQQQQLDATETIHNRRAACGCQQHRGQHDGAQHMRTRRNARSR